MTIDPTPDRCRRKVSQPLRVLAPLVALVVWAGPAAAQDVQPGHYAPGWNGGLRAGVMPADPGLYTLATTMFYQADKFIDGSGETTSRDQTDYVLQALALAWRPDLQLLGGDVQLSVTPAVGNLSSVPVLVDGQFQDPPVGIGDLFLSPFGLGWHWDEVDLTAALGGFAPTGRYSFGDSDNVGLGFWTAMPYLVASYRTARGPFQDTPFLAMGALRYEIHSNQKGRDFRPGDTLTAEAGVGLQLAERTEAGIVGYVYRQTTDANGSDAVSTRKYRANGIGATIAHGIGPLNLGLRFYQDFDVRNGPEGTLVFLEIGWGFPFGGAG